MKQNITYLAIASMLLFSSCGLLEEDCEGVIGGICEQCDCAGVCMDDYVAKLGDGACDEGDYIDDFWGWEVENPDFTCEEFNCDESDCGAWDGTECTSTSLQAIKWDFYSDSYSATNISSTDPAVSADSFELGSYFVTDPGTYSYSYTSVGTWNSYNYSGTYTISENDAPNVNSCFYLQLWYSFSPDFYQYNDDSSDFWDYNSECAAFFQNPVYPESDSEVSCTDPCYIFDESLTGNQCDDDCDCAGERTCSGSGYCTGDQNADSCAARIATIENEGQSNLDQIKSMEAKYNLEKQLLQQDGISPVITFSTPDEDFINNIDSHPDVVIQEGPNFIHKSVKTKLR